MTRTADIHTSMQVNDTLQTLRERAGPAERRLLAMLAAHIGTLEDRVRRTEQECERLLDENVTDHAMLRAVIERMPAGVVVVESPSGRTVLDNEQVNRILRDPYLSTNDVRERLGRIRLHPDGRPYRPEECPLSRSIATGERVTDEEIAFVRPDGSTGCMAVSSAPVTAPGDAARYGVAVIRDITEQKQVEEELRTSRDRVALALDALQAGVSYWDFENDRAEWNPRQYELLGYAPGSVEPGMPALVDRLHPGDRDRVLAELERSSRERKDFVMEYRVCLPGGEERWVRSVRRFAYNAAGRAISSHGIMYEITDRKHHDAIRQKAYDQIEQNMEQFAILGDHIRHPLQVILARADLMDDAEAAASIRQQVRRINTIVRQLDRGWVESRAIREFLRKNEMA
ncbi:PAS domain S-box protein [Methanoculleus sp. FWC-SCC1]|uniref:histidine kinase n=1 Tax=Methanoculleus frigidifontis TaxID=2584085 RepID=A0ABT8M974_9EURY|nr:PAS domain-containing protein [Methanoculleus sp. FWC-SCC1]MDN7024482.1 PAS domain S-box protein [Methanoculleus sp. FWC-SCC1]